MRFAWVRTAAAASVLLAMLCGLAVSAAAAADEEALRDDGGKSSVQLTDKQRKEIAKLHESILAKKKALVAKYVEYGVISREKGDEIIGKMERRFDRLKMNGYIPNWKKCDESHHRHSSESAED